MGYKAPKQQEPTLRPVLLKGRRSSDCRQPVTSPRSAPECLRTEKTAELNRVLCDTAHCQSLVGEESVDHGSLQAGSGSVRELSEEKHYHADATAPFHRTFKDVNTCSCRS